MGSLKRESTIKKRKTCLLYAASAFLLSAFILPAFSQNYKNEAGTTSDNDVYIAFLKDRYYTNGNFLHYRHAIKQAKTSLKFAKKILEFELGQKIFTPYSAQAPNPALHDRPFTAYLYAGTTLIWFLKNESLFKLSAQIGTIGPNALGQEVQTSYHKLLGIYKIMGWEYQLKNEAGLNLSGDYNRLLYRTKNQKADITAASSAMLGNTFSGANLGTMLRFGKINPLYQSISYNSLISNNPTLKEKPHKEFFLFTKPQLNFVAYDATIEGGLFSKDRGPITFGIKHLVYSQQVGLSFSADRWSASYIATFKGKEVESSADPYRYASLILLYRFN